MSVTLVQGNNIGYLLEVESVDYSAYLRACVVFLSSRRTTAIQESISYPLLEVNAIRCR